MDLTGQTLLLEELRARPEREDPLSTARQARKRKEGSGRKGGGVREKGVWANSMPIQQPIG